MPLSLKEKINIKIDNFFFKIIIKIIKYKKQFLFKAGL